jgi:membrane-bound metal-dependent hydrolase YbcI (DUF457 family)
MLRFASERSPAPRLFRPVPSPLAHIGAALALQLALQAPGHPWSRRVALAAAFASIAPDFDLLPAVLLPDGIAWHHGPTHSLVGAAVIGGMTAVVARVRDRAGAATVVGAALLHVLFDWSTGEPGGPARFGVPWAWPFDPTRSVAAHPWFGAFHIDRAGFLSHMWAEEAIPVYGTEITTAIVLLLVGAAICASRRYFAVSPPSSTNS